jgi:4-hydroxy-3-polyprenylbenzoate decarboxylase
MLWRDLREYLQRLDELGELRKVEEASWEEDIGGITELMTERQGPALLFDQIPGYPDGYRVASNLFTTPRRTAIALGVPLEPALEGLAERWARRMDGVRPVPPTEVSSGPILENVLRGDEVDLYKFPTPQWHDNDGGRYIGTGLCVIQKDPDTGFVNVGAYRVSIVDKRTCAIFTEHGKHGDLIQRKYWDRGEKCPVIIAVGQEPVLTALAGSSVYHCPAGVSEFEVAGYVLGGAYPVVRGELTGLPMPAHGEIVIEGFIPSAREVMVPEGPFGEWTGYYAHGRRPEPIIEVVAIYHRSDPIIFGLPPTRPLTSQFNANFGPDQIEPKRRLEKAGIPGVQSVYVLARPNMRAVAIKQMYDGHVDDVIRILAPGGDQYSGHHIWVLVDDDVDVTKPEEVMWAIASRCAPEYGVKVIPGTAVWQLDPRIPPPERSTPAEEEQGRKRYTAHALVINACRPYEWIDEFPPVNVNRPELRKRIEERWKQLFA